MRYLPEKLGRVGLFLQRVVVDVTGRQQVHLFRLDFDGLAFGR